ncbi:intestinal mucin-like protein [Alosa sapidissima]|uniref:intestinal mucin-like protein n=1 Tax=Alosa sapidissima TaxID=34773 RepID=UPI001C08F7A3|nr:intestinal mucin-like protein [Alosa sapidissima]
MLCSPTSAPSTTPLTLTTPTPSTTISTSTTPSLDCYPRKNGETWVSATDKCMLETCFNGEIIKHLKKCPTQPPLSCANGLPPKTVPDGSGCCFKQECQCHCFGFGDPHYVTFDGTYYGFQGNCSYILVKEIKPIYNFSIIIDNVYCDAPDGLSCPKSLTIHYKSFEIFMSQEVSHGIVTNLIYVNHKRIYPAYSNSDFQVTNNGIEALVVIPAIGAQIMFSGLQFSVELPWSKFHGNTEGQCGTCDNNRTDDCLLPNGKIDPSCPNMAHQWKVNDSNCPVPPPTIPPSTCPPETLSICKIIASKVFEKCHEVVRYEPFIEGCEFDICYTKKPSIGCASLQSYAQQCALNGICIDWRGATDGVCDFECNAPLVYKPCGPQVPPTCDKWYNFRFIEEKTEFTALTSMRWEGCYCPDGTTLLDHETNECVSPCGPLCRLPNGEWKQGNSTWISGCDLCTCDADDERVYCNPLPCPSESPVICDQPGQIKVPEKVGCCEIDKCVCDVTTCPTHSCPIGYIQETEVGACCPKCVPKPVCVYNNTEYLPHSSVPMRHCETCLCSDKLENDGSLHRIECEPITCDTYCPQGFEPVLPPGECCAKCVQTMCVVVYSGNLTHSIPVNGIWSPPGNKCVKYECVKVGSTFITMEARTLCPPYNPNDCIPGTEVIAPDGCCHLCVRKCNRTTESTYLQHNGCTSSQKVDLTTCQGLCPTFSWFSLSTSTFQRSCSCCQEITTSKREVEMVCPDGSKFSYSYNYIEQCGCLQSTCTTMEKTVTKRLRRRR